MTPITLIDSLLKEGLVPVVVGPTASGKTGLMVSLSEHFRGCLDVISADAFQVYRGMNIGTAKPAPAVLSKVPHRLVDICSPWETYTAGRFARDADDAITATQAAGRVAVVCGGSGLYVSALVTGLHETRRGAARPAGDRSTLADELRSLDPGAADRLKDAPIPRLARALEIVRETGMTLDETRSGDRKTSSHRFRIIRIVVDRRGVLYPRIDARVLTMMDQGLVAEIEALRREGVMPDTPSQRAIGYREIHRMLDGDLARDEAVRLMQRNTRRYAKRQETWFRTQFQDVIEVTL